jgi:hypothetical protein
VKKGLPLANPAQAGVILEDTIFQGYGNWIGVEQYLDLVFFSNSFTPDVIRNQSAGTDSRIIMIDLLR